MSLGSVFVTRSCPILMVFVARGTNSTIYLSTIEGHDYMLLQGVL